jgi:hypothetical protein
MKKTAKESAIPRTSNPPKTTRAFKETSQPKVTPFQAAEELSGRGPLGLAVRPSAGST